MTMRTARWSGWRRADSGQVSAFVVTLVTGIVMLAGLVLDGGLALATKVEAVGQAQSAARAGAQHLDLAAYRDRGTVQLDPHAAAAAARAYLASIGADGTVSATLDTVEVTVTAASGTQLLGMVGIDTIHVSGSGSAQAQRAQEDPSP